MGAMASQITSLTIAYSTIYSGADERKHQKLSVTGLVEGNSPVTGEFPAQKASNTENVLMISSCFSFICTCLYTELNSLWNKNNSVIYK